MIRRLLSCLLLVASPISAANYKLQAEHFTFQGFFRLPANSDFRGDEQSITYADDCMGETDPSPGDGYPGCLMYTDFCNVSMSDIVPPTAAGTNSAAQVFVNWNVTGGMCGSYTPSTSKEFQIHYDNTGVPCRVVWQVYSDYAERPYDTDNVFGYSDCSISTPNAQGMYRWTSQGDADTSPEDPYDANKYAYNLRRIPAAVASDYFSGNAMLLGPGKSTGSRGSSAGPSLAIRPWTFPTDAGGWDELVPVIYYPSATGFPRWYIPSDFRNADNTNWNIGQEVSGGEIIRIASGGDNYEALVFMGNVGVVDPNVYPLNTPSAKPTEPPYDTGGDTYQNPGSQPWPDPDVVPAMWYGEEIYNSTPPAYDEQDPSFTDYTSTGQRMPGDTNLVAFCDKGTGQSVQASRTRIWLYDLAEVGAMYQGTSGYAYNELQPHSQITLAFDPGNDGFDTEKDTCAQNNRRAGTAYAPDQQLLFIVIFPDVTWKSQWWTSGTHRGVAVYSVTAPGEPPVQGEGKIVEGGGISGGKIE